MTLLHIALQDGFVEDNVTVTVNSEEVFQKKDVSTRFQIGLADSFELDISENLADVHFSIPTKDFSFSIILPFSAPVYLGLSITVEDQIRLMISSTPYRYI